MKPANVVAVVGGALLTGVVFFALGRWTRPSEDWSRQHENRSSDAKEFRNAFLGLTVRAPEGSDWQLVFEREKLRPVPGVRVNKVLEINRILQEGGTDRQWARMDLFVEPLLGGIAVEQAVRRLEFRDRRSGFRMVSTEDTTIGSKAAKVRVSAWMVTSKKFRTVNYYVEHRDRLYAFVGVVEAGGYDRFRPTFDRIVASVRFD